MYCFRCFVGRTPTEGARAVYSSVDHEVGCRCYCSTRLIYGREWHLWQPYTNYLLGIISLQNLIGGQERVISKVTGPQAGQFGVRTSAGVGYVFPLHKWTG